MKLIPRLLKYLFIVAVVVSAAKNFDQRFVQYRLSRAETQIVFPDGGTCSATWVGPHTILTAEHCFTGDVHSHPPVNFDGNGAAISLGGHVPTVITHVEADGSDHALVSVVDEAPATLPIAQVGFPREGTEVTVLGHPGRRPDPQLEHGVSVGWDKWEDHYCTVWDLSSFPGVSGEALVDWRGRIVAVLSLANDQGYSLTLPLNFSSEQLRNIK